MNKRLWVLPVLAAILVAGSGVGFAAMPSLYGPTGIVTVPNAMVAPVGDLGVALSYQSQENSLISGLDTYDALDTDVSLWSIQALAGVAEGAELWAAYSKDNSDLDVATWGIGGKYAFYCDPSSGAQFALGAGYRSGSGDANLIVNFGTYGLDDFQAANVDVDANVTDVYLVATKDFSSVGGSEWCPGAKLLGSLGLLYKNLNADVTASSLVGTLSGEFDESLFRPFVGVQWIGAEGPYFGLEYRWEDDDLDIDPVFSAVLGYNFIGTGWTGEVGTTNADQFGLGTGNQDWFVRVGYTFATGGAW